MTVRISVERLQVAVDRTQGHTRRDLRRIATTRDTGLQSSADDAPPRKFARVAIVISPFKCCTKGIFRLV